MGVFQGGSGDRGPGAESVRRLVARLGCTPAEALALAVLVVGAVAVLGVLWLLARPGPPPDSGSESASTPAPQGDEPVTGPELEAEELVVHVAGEVASPGLHELPAGARVADALEAAGGPTDEALTAALNLAREVSDGEQLYVPGPEEAAAGGDAPRGQPGGPANAGGGRSTAPAPRPGAPTAASTSTAPLPMTSKRSGVSAKFSPSAGYAYTALRLPAKG